MGIGSSHSTAPFPRSSRNGATGTGVMRSGIRGESYWLDSYRKPSSASTSYAHGVRRLIENAGARYATGSRPVNAAMASRARATSSANSSRVCSYTRACA